MIGSQPWVLQAMDAASQLTPPITLAAGQQANNGPTWFTMAVAGGAPLVALLGVLIGQWVARGRVRRRYGGVRRSWKALLDVVLEPLAERYRGLKPGRTIDVEVAGEGGPGGVDG